MHPALEYVVDCLEQVLHISSTGLLRREFAFGIQFA
jgi:hypothetical protein